MILLCLMNRRERKAQSKHPMGRANTSQHACLNVVSGLYTLDDHQQLSHAGGQGGDVMFTLGSGQGSRGNNHFGALHPHQTTIFSNGGPFMADLQKVQSTWNFISTLYFILLKRCLSFHLTGRFRAHFHPFLSLKRITVHKK